jgi:hypothetical protein
MLYDFGSQDEAPPPRQCGSLEGPHGVLSGDR